MIKYNIRLSAILPILKAIPFVLGVTYTQSAHATNAPNPDLNPSPNVPNTIGNCPDYQGAIDLPNFAWPQQAAFNSWGSYYWSKNYEPYHMVHDEIANPGETITITGKFDYSRVFHKDLEGEYIRAYIYGSDMKNWEYLGRYKTDSDGKVSVPVTAKTDVSEFIVRMVVEGDLSSADGFISVAPKHQDTVIFDIDGTMTLDDFQEVGDYLGVSTAQSWPYAKESVQAYIDKGYRVIFLTGRPYWIGRDTREWFTDVIDLPQWLLHTNDFGGSPLKLDAETYKREYLNYLQDEVGLNIIRAYGNATTDISAYLDAGIPAQDVWIIGENAGLNGTQPIIGDYSGHYVETILPTQEATCRQ